MPGKVSDKSPQMSETPPEGGSVRVGTGGGGGGGQQGHRPPDKGKPPKKATPPKGRR